MTGECWRSTPACQPQPVTHTCLLRTFHSLHARIALFTTARCTSKHRPTAPVQNSGRPTEPPLEQAWSRTLSQEPLRSSPSSFFVFNDEVHFSSRLTSSGVEIWKTNGTSSGTVRAHAYSGCYVSNCNFHSVIEYNGSFYGGGHWNNNGREVLMYNSSGLSLLVDLSPGQRFNIPRMTNPSAFLVHDGWLWFLTNGNHRAEMATVCTEATERRLERRRLSATQAPSALNCSTMNCTSFCERQGIRVVEDRRNGRGNRHGEGHLHRNEFWTCLSAHIDGRLPLLLCEDRNCEH